LNMSGGTLAPGNSPGMTTINGDYLLTGGLLDMELAGLTQGTGYDFLDINGNWTITGGDLQISLLGGFTPMAGNSFDLFDFNSLTGMFDNVFLPTLGSGLSWNTSSLYTTGVLSVNNAAAVPEPSTFGLLAIGSLSCIVLRRRRSGLAKQV
ncbi:MAG: PEP-CTERM sorting domain-containing protein, partial [Planctomycetaceae bacterium]|nr:PEP-CTERM sorting domain-containing protein [Planctomycetaceae bacterium]